MQIAEDIHAKSKGWYFERLFGFRSPLSIRGDQLASPFNSLMKYPAVPDPEFLRIISYWHSTLMYFALLSTAFPKS